MQIDSNQQKRSLLTRANVRDHQNAKKDVQNPRLSGGVSYPHHHYDKPRYPGPFSCSTASYDGSSTSSDETESTKSTRGYKNPADWQYNKVRSNLIMFVAIQRRLYLLEERVALTHSIMIWLRINLICGYNYKDKKSLGLPAFPNRNPPARLSLYH
jgi:hypothetical protein